MQFLLDDDVIVQRATRQFTRDGTRYAAGSYVVDLQQAKRGMANTILDPSGPSRVSHLQLEQAR